MPIAVVLPCRNSRHLLWRSLASVAAQTVPPAQILVLDRGSTDGLGDWLRACWPGVELRTLPADADAATVGAAIATAVSAPTVARSAPGRSLAPSHLEALLGKPDPPPAAELVPTADLATPTGAQHCPGRRTMSRSPSPRALAEAIASLPAAARRSCSTCARLPRRGLLDLLGLAALVGSLGPKDAALSLADLAWPALDAVPPSAPCWSAFRAPWTLARASEQLCIEELIRRTAGRPVRLVLGGLGPSAPALCPGCSTPRSPIPTSSCGSATP